MQWPPKVGELMPRAEDAVGVRRKLANYSLDVSHEDGGPKARGFALILGITIESIDYLEAEIRSAILYAQVTAVRHDRVGGLNCVVEFDLRGVGDYGDRVVVLRTIWELAEPASPPRLITALLKP